MRALKVSSVADYAATTAAGWQSVSGEQIALVPAPHVMQPNGFVQAQWQDKPYGRTPWIETAAVHDGQTLAVHLRWPSDKPNNGGREGFPDGAAIAFPVSGEPALWSMGTEDEPVQFIQWRAIKNEVRSVVAWGIGTSTSAGSVSETVSAGWSQGHWKLVITRALAGGSEAASLVPGQATRIGFAVWNGSNEERGGIKAVAEDWLPLELDN